MAAYDAGPDDWMDAQPQAKAPADTGLNDWQDAPGAPQQPPASPQQQPVAKGLSQEIDDWQDPPRQGGPAAATAPHASSAPSIPSTPSTPSAPPEPAFIPPNTYDEATITKQGAAVQSKGVNPNGSVPGYKPTLDKANAGDKWTTISASQDGLNLTFVVPENPAFNDFIKQHQTEIDNEEIPNPYLEELKKTGKQYGVYESDAAAAKDMQAKPSTYEQLASDTAALPGQMAGRYGEGISNAWEQLKKDFLAQLPPEAEKYKAMSGWEQLKDQFSRTLATGATVVDAFNLAIAPVTSAIGVGTMVAGKALDQNIPIMGKQETTGGWESALNEALLGLAPGKGGLHEVFPPGPSAGAAAHEAAAGAFSGATAEALNKPLAIEDMRGRGPEEAAPPEAPRSPDGGVNDWADVATPTEGDRFGPQFGGIDDWQDAPQGAATHEPIAPAEPPSNEVAKSNIPPEAPAEAAPSVQIAADYSEPIPAPAEAPSPPVESVNTRGNRPVPPPPVNLREILNDKRSLEEIKAEREAAIKASEPAAGTREAPAPANDMEAMDNARGNVETQPSEAQKEAGNYQKGHVDIHGMDVTIETPKGAERTGPIDKTTGEPTWTNVHPEADYGYIKRTNGADGEQVDVYIGPNPDSPKAYVVDQYDPKTGKFDEHKSILGADSQEQAIAIYDRGFSDGSGPARRKGVTEMPVRQFKQWAMKGDTTKPLVKVIQARQAKPLRADVESDLIHTIRAMGGIKLKDAKGDVTKEGQDVMAALKDFRRPGLINNKAGGLPPDQVLKTLREQRWFVDAPDQGADIQNLYDILGRAGQAEAGVKVHHPESEAARTQLQAKDEAADARGRADIEALGKKAGFELSNSEIDAVIARMQEGVDAESAIHDHFERAAIADLDAGAEENPGEDYEVPFEGELAEAPSQAGEAVQRPQSEAAHAAPGREISQGAEGVSPNPQETRQAPQVEAGAEGLPQSVIPGAERMSEQEVARRRKLEANQRGMAEMKVKQQQSKMRKGGQQSAGGMFDEGRNQTDLLSQPIARKEPPLFKTPGVSPTPSKLNLDVVSGKAHADEVMQMELDAMKKAEKRSASTSDDGGAMERAPGAVGRGTPQEVQAKKAPARQSESPSESVPSKQKPQITQSEQGPKAVDKTALSESVPSKPKPPTPASGGRYESKRKFQSYTTAELKAAAADTEKNSPEQIARLKEEIAAREAGASKPFKTPQIVPKKQEPKGPPDEAPKFQARHAPTFFSALEKGIGAIKMEKAPPIQWRNTIKNLGGVKKEELDWSGIDQWLETQKGPVTKDQVLDQVRQNNVQVKEVVRGGPSHDETAPDEMAQEEYKARWDKLNAEINKASAEEQRTRRNGLRASSDENLTAIRALGKLDDAREEMHHQMVLETRERMKARGLTGDKPAKFEQHRLPGGENYRELLLTLPEKSGGERGPQGWGDTAGGTTDTANFRGGHFDEPNVIVHIRFDDRKGPNGEKVLHVAEVQSDMHQKARRVGYSPDPADRERLNAPVLALRPDVNEMLKRNDWLGFETHAEARNALATEPKSWDLETDADRALAERWSEARMALHRFDKAKMEGIPNAPFKTTWHELAMKKMLRYASEHGYDRLSWDTGATNADRFDLGKQVESVIARKQKDGTFSLAFVEKGQTAHTVTPGLFTEKELSDQLGKDLAEKVIERAKTTEPGHAIEFSGLDLKLGNTGMQGFYDKILPDFMNKYAKKWGAKVEPSSLRVGPDEKAAEAAMRSGDSEAIGNAVSDRTMPVHSIPITDAMRESVMGGQPLFKNDVPFGRRVGALPPRVRRGVPSEPGRINISANISATPVANATAAQKALMDQIGALAKRIIPGTTARPMAKIEAQGMGLGEGMRPVEGVAYGTPGKRVIAWSLESADAAGTLRHEALHYLREYMSDEEWQTLVAAARRGNWMKKHQIDERYPGLKYEEKMEEAIAEEIGVWRRFKDSKIPEAVRGIFQRIAEFLAAVAKHVRKLFGAHATANDIFSDVMSGKMGREAKQGAAGSEGPKFQAARQPPGPTQPGLGLPSVAEPVGKKLTNLEDQLFRIRQNNEDDRTAIRQIFKKMPKAMFDPALQERMYQHAEENTKLIPEEQAMYDKWIKPLKKEENAVYNRIKDTGYPVSPDGYMHRIVQGKGSMYDEAQGSLSQSPTYGRVPRSQNKLNKTAPSMKERTVFMAEGDQGTLRIVRGDDYKPGDTYRDNGENFTVRQATTREIEENTDLRYFKNALVNTADNVMRLRRAERSIDFLEQLKQDPTFQENAQGPGSTERIPPDWKTTRLPQLAGWKMNPRLANLFDDFYGHGETNLDMIVGRVNRAIVSSIFVNPVSSFFGHGANVAGHWFVSRGWSNFLPHTYAQSAANGMKAIRDVVTLSPNYRQLMRQGAALQLAPVLNRKFHETMIKAMQGDMNARPQNWQEIAKTAGTTPKAIYDALSHVSSAGLWGLNDVLLLQRIYDLQGRSNMSPKQAIRDAERGIPNYRIPTEAWEGPGGRTFSELLQNGNLTLFGRYRYGILKAYAETIKDMGGKEKTPKQRIKGLGEALALVALVALIYPQADKAWRYATGNKEATARRAGPTTLPDALTSAATGGPKDFSAALGGLFGMSPAIQSAVELGSNRELFTGNRIYNPQGSALEIAKELGYYGATQFTPVEQAAQIARGRRQFYPETVGTMVGVKLPEPGEAQRLRRIRALEKRRESQRFRRIENSIKRGIGIQ